MKIRSKLLPTMALTTALLTFLLLGLAVDYTASITRPPPPFTIKLEPVGTLDKTGPITMRLDYSAYHGYLHLARDSGSYSVIFLNPRDSKDTLSITTYPVSYDETYSHSTTFEVTLPVADTNWCVILVSCGALRLDESWHFVKSGESLQFLQYYRMPPVLEYQGQKARISQEVDRDTLSQEDLQKLYRIVINIRDPKDRQFVENLVGVVPDSSVYNRKRGDYLIETTAENMLKFIDRNIELENITNRPGDPKLKRDKDSLQEDLSEPDSSDHQGSLPNKYLHTAYEFI